MMPFLVLAAAYLIGGIPFGYLSGEAPKAAKTCASMGSGNIGATNVLRTTGRALGFATLLLDIAKGAFASGLPIVTCTVPCSGCHSRRLP